MGAETRDAFREDAYLQTLEATLLRTEGERGLVFDASNFFAAGGGQPGDRGVATFSDGSRIEIVDTVHGPDKRSIVLLSAEGTPLPEPGSQVRLEIDWERSFGSDVTSEMVHNGLQGIMAAYRLYGKPRPSDAPLGYVREMRYKGRPVSVRWEESWQPKVDD